MTWTTEPPTGSGWYWAVWDPPVLDMREAMTGRPQKPILPSPPALERVIRWRDGLAVEAHGEMGVACYPLTCFSRWAGPLRPPEGA